MARKAPKGKAPSVPIGKNPTDEEIEKAFQEAERKINEAKDNGMGLNHKPSNSRGVWYGRRDRFDNTE